MKIRLLGEESREIHAFAEPGMEVEADDPDLSYSALQMHATALSLCAYSVPHRNNAAVLRSYLRMLSPA